MSDCLNVHLLPSCAPPEGLAGRCAVVIDVLRATTTIAAALAAGARCVYPTLEIAEARRRAAELPSGSALLAGERGGLRIEGFDLGNSPREFTPAVVAGRAICFTTTNGTRALLHAAAAARILPAALVNRAALARSVEREPQIEILCAGTRGEVSREDVLTAGALVEMLPGRTLDDSARLALTAWRECVRPLGDGTRRALASSAILRRLLCAWHAGLGGQRHRLAMRSRGKSRSPEYNQRLGAFTRLRWRPAIRNP